MKKIIAIDYDKTITLDPTLWRGFIKDAKGRGFKVLLVTMRAPEDNTNELRKMGKVVDKVIFTCKKAKKPFLEKMGIYPDVWVDDSPEYILQNKTTPVRGKQT